MCAWLVRFAIYQSVPPSSRNSNPSSKNPRRRSATSSERRSSSPAPKAEASSRPRIWWASTGRWWSSGKSGSCSTALRALPKLGVPGESQQFRHKPAQPSSPRRQRRRRVEPNGPPAAWRRPKAFLQTPCSACGAPTTSSCTSRAPSKSPTTRTSKPSSGM